MVCIGFGVVIAAIALVSASMRPIPTPQIDVYIDRDGRPTVIPNVVPPYTPEPYRPPYTPTPHRPWRPGSDTGDKGKKEGIIDKKESLEKETRLQGFVTPFWRI
jgi:hypothetical protein